MYSSERDDEIYQYLKDHQRASVEELSAHFYVSPATIRRALDKLQSLGMIKRTHGGALYYDRTSEVSIFARQEKNDDLKRKVVDIAMPHLPFFTSIFIDNSSTCLKIASLLDLEYKTVITNGFQVALVVNRKPNVKLVLPGGEVEYNANAVSGSVTCNMLRDFHCDLMLSSCAAVDTGGVYEFSQDTAQIKRTVFNNCKYKILLADKTKLETNAIYKVMEPQAYDAIYSDVDDVVLQRYRQNGIKIFNR